MTDFWTTLCLNWHDGYLCLRPMGHRGKHRHSFRVSIQPRSFWDRLWNR